MCVFYVFYLDKRQKTHLHLAIFKEKNMNHEESKILDKVIQKCYIVINENRNNLHVHESIN